MWKLQIPCSELFCMLVFLFPTVLIVAEMLQVQEGARSPAVPDLRRSAVLQNARQAGAHSPQPGRGRPWSGCMTLSLEWNDSSEALDLLNL